MIAAALLAFREGLEAALILGIVLSVLRRFGRQDQQGIAWLGAGLAAVISLGAGIGLYILGTSFEGKVEQIFEGLTMLLAAGVLTWMIFWMSRQGRAVQDPSGTGSRSGRREQREMGRLFSRLPGSGA